MFKLRLREGAKWVARKRSVGLVKWGEDYEWSARQQGGVPKAWCDGKSPGGTPKYLRK